MMQKKRNGKLQKGIMVAVSALTVLASASTALAYQPMQWSDESFENTISEANDFYTFNTTFRIFDVNEVDFSKGDNIFTYLDGTQEVLDNIPSAHIMYT